MEEVLVIPTLLDDDSYLNDDLQRKAYLLDDVGIIWRGSQAQKLALHWQYGQVHCMPIYLLATQIDLGFLVHQYEDHCLDVALYLLKSLTADECRSASSVSRCLISRINTRDNSGVMAGSNGGSHMGGTHPCRWTGSTTILNKFYRTKTPVR